MGKKMGKNLQETNRGESLSRMDRRIDVICTDEQCYRVTTHSDPARPMRGGVTRTPGRKQS